MTEHTQSNETTITADGPHALADVRGALSGIELNDREVESISVTVSYKNQGSGGEQEASDDSGGGVETVEVQPPVMPAADRDAIDLSSFDFPASEPERIQKNSHHHVVMVVLVEMAREHGLDTAFTSDEIASSDGCPLSYKQVQSALTALYKNKSLLLRRLNGNAYEYIVTNELVSERERLGTYDLSRVAGVDA